MISFKDGHCLSEDYLQRANRVMRFEESVLAAFRSAAAVIRRNPPLLALFERCVEMMKSAALEELHELQYPDGALRTMRNEHEPMIREALREQSGMFDAFLVLAMLPRTAEIYRGREIPTHVLEETMSDMQIWMNRYYATHGVWGHDQLGWLLRHASGKLYRLGRLQFIATRFGGKIVVLRHRSTGEIAVLSEAGVAYRSDGMVDGTNAEYDEVGRWIAVLEQHPDYIQGNPVLPDGASRGLARYALPEWQIVLRKGDPVLDIHIAEGSKLSLEESKASLREAIAFYDRHFPEHRARAFVCASWLLAPQFPAILPASSNIVQFQRLFRLYPVLSDSGELYYRVFGTRTIDVRTASRDTGLRRAVLDCVAEGKQLHAAGGFRLMDEAE